MVAGLDRYFQVARCFRDEDLRADRQPEFTQLDMEMSFVEEDDVFQVWERALAQTFQDAMGEAIATPFPRMPWSESMERFGTDKPDMRFGLELVGVDEWAKTSEFNVFRGAVAAGGRVMGIVRAGEARAVAQGHHRPRGDGQGERREGPRLVEGERARRRRPALEVLRGRARRRADAAHERRRGRHLPLRRRQAGDRVARARRDPQHARQALRARAARRATLLVGHRVPDVRVRRGEKRWFSAHHPFTAPSDWTMGGENPISPSSRLAPTTSS